MNIPPYVRQLMVAGSPQLAAYAVGGAVTYPSVILQQFNTNTSTIHLDMDTASWIGSIHGLTGIPSILMPAIMQWRGRKFAFIAACLISIIGWLVAYSASTAGAILISESFHGLGSHCLLAVSLLSMSEMIAPKLRTISMVSFSLVQALGMASVGAIARYVHWKTISIIMCTFMMLAFLIALTWPESPFWLAYRKEFDKCEKAFTSLRGAGEDSKKELKQLITAQNKQKSNKRSSYDFLAVLRRRDFYIPTLCMFLLMNLMYWSGTMVILIYSTDVIKKATGNEDIAAIAGVIVNTILFLGITTTTILIRYFSNKYVLISSAIGTASFLVLTSIVTFLQSTGSLSEDSLLSFYCIIAYMITNSLGVSSVVFSMAAELMPVKHKGIGGGLYVVFSCILHSSSLKAAPYLFVYLNLWGTYLLYAINAIVSTILIWKFLPDTKGRTLQEIEDYYNNLSFEKKYVFSDVEKPILNEGYCEIDDSFKNAIK